MGLSATISKNYNYLNTDFIDAYWYLSQVGIGEQNNKYIVCYTLTAYPSRESKQKTINRDKVSQYSIGGSTHYQYDAELYEFVDIVPFEKVFPENNVPSSLDELKSKVYQYIKSISFDINFIDVLEEGQTIIS